MLHWCRQILTEVQEQFGDTKGIFRSRKSKDRKYNDRMRQKSENTNKGQQNIIKRTINGNNTKNGLEHMCSRRVC